MPIRNLSSVSSLSTGDNFAIGSAENGDDRRVSLSTLLTYLQNNLTFDSSNYFDTQYAAPSATGFSVQITDSDSSTHLILMPVAGYAAGTIILPLSSNCIDKQQVIVNCTQAVTTLTVDGNGATVTGAPTTMAANSFFTLKYDLPGTTWYRVA